MKNSLLLLLILILFIGCNPEIFNLKTKACFDYSPTNNLKTRDTINFSNCSTNSNYYIWYFGDGDYSLEKEPKHSYRFMESYQVKLIAANRSENNIYITHDSDTIIKFINISIGVPKACFKYTNLFGTKVSFTNCSSYGTNYYWNFGDGTNSNEENPIHNYVYSGSYNVKLKISNDIYIDSINNIITVSDEISLNNNIGIKNFPATLDIDDDRINDLLFTTITYNGVSNHFSYSKITPLNNYEIAIDTIVQRTWDINPSNLTDTVFNLVTRFYPKIYVLGDRILNSNDFSNKALNLSIYDSSNYGYRSIIDLNFWNKDEIRYIGFRKTIGNITKIGWIKLKVLNYTNVTLYSYKIPVEVENLLIDK